MRRTNQKKGLGQALLKLPVFVPCVVHAKDEAARQWTMNWEFEPSATDPLHLFLLLKGLKAALVNTTDV